MKKFGIALLASALLFSGCELLNGKKDDDGGQGGQQQSGGGAAAVDPATFTTAYGPVQGLPNEDAKVGMSVTVETKAGGQTTTYSAAIVGEDGDNWLIESGQLVANYKDYLVGMTVSKKDGMIQSAVLGKKGEAPKKIKHQNTKPAAAQGGGGEAPATVDCKISIGTFKAYMNEAGGTKTWVGAEGDMQGVLLKMESAQGGKELKAKPETVTLDLGGTSVEARKLAWDNGDVQITTDHAAVKVLNYGMVENTTKHSSSKVTTVGMDAKPELKWEMKK